MRVPGKRVGGRVAGFLAWCLLLFAAGSLRADEAQWIWSPAYEKEMAPEGTCYFRKTFNLGAAPEQGEIQIGCDDSYELFVNGRLVGSGNTWKVLDVYDITKFLVQGPNIVAVKANNTAQGSAGLVARVVVKAQGGTHVAHSTDATWKTAIKEFPQWQKTRFNDVQWLAARSFGAMGSTLPWGNEVTVAGEGGRFKLVPDFRVEWVVEGKQTGSLISMTFNEFGDIIAARENGGLVIVYDSDSDGILDSVDSMCEEIKNCQGLLCVSGRVFAIGQGPQGTALYRLTDEDHDGKTERIDALVKFTGEMGEHGPHSLALGPDGLIYMVVGNFARPEKIFEDTSPLRKPYEGDLVTPRYEDAGGHAVGIKAPGGTIIRTDSNGSAVELVAGGLQNPYDLAFNSAGQLFTADSDMEWDLGFSWYRPTRVNHIVPGGDFGWRSGWAKWPDYYLDSLPPLVELGRGSPTGLEVYNHFMFPKRYHDALFVCDWSRGRILAVKMKPFGATYKATSEVFLEGQPLNVTDIAVGPDGSLYFCTGGRETEGGIYRVVWNGKVPPEISNPGEGVAGALKQPQLNSAWARQRIATIKQQTGKTWGSELRAIAEDAQQPLPDRLRALDLMQIFGPLPAPTWLVKIAGDPQVAVRERAAYLMGVRTHETTHARLLEMLGDHEQAVQRAACEALVRSGQPGTVDKLVKLLGSTDRHVSWSARQALLRMPREQWQPAVLQAKDAHVFAGGAAALLAHDPPAETCSAVLNRGAKLLGGYLSDPDFMDLLRVIQLALLKGEFAGDDVPELRKQLSAEYPSQDVRMNRELVRLLTYLQEPTAAPRFVEQLSGDSATMEKLHVALHARFLQTGWTLRDKLEVLKFYEEARTMQGGHSFAGYIENVARDFFAGFSDDERKVVLTQGAKWPSSALSVLIKLPMPPSSEIIEQLIKLDRQVKTQDSDSARRLRIGIVAVLGTSKDELSMAYLREVFDKEPDRRVPVAMGLAQQPDGDNWPYLVRSLAIVEGSAAQEVLIKLAAVDRIPQNVESYRQVILRGLMLRENGSRHAITLLEKWTGEQHSRPNESWDVAMGAWQQWFHATYPEVPEAKLPVESEQNNWTYQELLSYLTGPQATQGDSLRGSRVFEKAQCAKCHRFGGRGEVVGPDLSTVSQRFQKKEILESILFPSQVISDQYATQTVQTKDGRSIVGMVAPTGDGALVILQSSGDKAIVSLSDVEERVRTKVSAMPDGLLNTLTVEEINDLFAYLTKASTGDFTRRVKGVLK